MAITYKEIEKANITIRTTKIKGKEYAEVNQRIKAFRMLYPEGYIKSEVLELDTTNGVIVMRATVGYYDENGTDRVLGYGTAFEWRNDSKSLVNKTSYIENCETSAVGRALGMIGLGIDVAIASADEVKYAVAHQEEMNEAPAPVTDENTTPICVECKNPISSHGEYTPEQVAELTNNTFKKNLCWDCAHKEQERLKALKAKKAEAKKAESNMKVDKATGLPFPMDD